MDAKGRRRRGQGKPKTEKLDSSRFFLSKMEALGRLRRGQGRTKGGQGEAKGGQRRKNSIFLKQDGGPWEREKEAKGRPREAKGGQREAKGVQMPKKEGEGSVLAAQKASLFWRPLLQKST